MVKPWTELTSNVTELTSTLRDLSFERIICKTQESLTESELMKWLSCLFMSKHLLSHDSQYLTTKKRLAAKRLFYPNSCAVKCIFQLTKFADLSRLDTLIIYNVKVFFLYLKTKVTAFNFL